MPAAIVADCAAAGRTRQPQVDQAVKDQKCRPAHSGVLRVRRKYFCRARHARGREWLSDETSSYRKDNGRHSRCYERRDFMSVGRWPSVHSGNRSGAGAQNHYPLRSGNRLEDLSDREMHIFQLIGSGLSTKQIAQSLKLSVKTVESHRENIKHNLHLSSGEELRERAAKWVVQILTAEEHVCRTAGQEQKGNFGSDLTNT